MRSRVPLVPGDPWNAEAGVAVGRLGESGAVERAGPGRPPLIGLAELAERSGGGPRGGARFSVPAAAAPSPGERLFLPLALFCHRAPDGDVQAVEVVVLGGQLLADLVALLGETGVEVLLGAPLRGQLPREGFEPALGALDRVDGRLVGGDHLFLVPRGRKGIVEAGRVQ